MNAMSEVFADPARSWHPKWFTTFRLRVFFWILGVLVGLVQTWRVRHEMFSDGLSYSQIAMAYLQGDWKDAINPYWSPLYSWVLAAAYKLLSPPPYWEVATLHLVNYLAFLASLFCFELFMRELLRWNRRRPEGEGFSDFTLLLAGYTAFLFETLSQIHIAATSPDMIAMSLVLMLSTLLWRVRMKGGSNKEFAAIAVLCAALFLARAAFAPCFIVALAAVAAGLWRQRRPWLLPCTMIIAIVVALTAPFILAISKQVGHFTLGETGRLNYAWEVNTAPRFRHWQGEPKDLGVPKHPTHLVLSHPQVFTFAEPIGGTYPAWYNPAYWYDGIKPHFNLKQQLEVTTVNLSILVLIFCRSPIFVPCLLLIPFCGASLWWTRYRKLWPVTLLSWSVVALYALVYVERRYMGGQVLLLWMTLLVSIPLCGPRIRQWATGVIAGLCIVFLTLFLVIKQGNDIKYALSDLYHRHETFPNMNWVIAQQIKKLGIKPGDRVAYIGMSDLADWTRLAQVKIVAEVPVHHSRNRKLFNNIMNEERGEVNAFWAAPPEVKEQVYAAFRSAGAKIAITDEGNPNGAADSWPLLVPKGTYPIEDPKAVGQDSARYHLLTE
jgi:hypothetical protein